MADREFQRWMDGLELSTPPEFFPAGYSRKICNDLLTEEEQAGIFDAALLAHMGDEDEACRARKRAGY